jgi:virulence factor Mce-like protein
MPERDRHGSDLISNPILVGTVIIAIIVIGVFLSYNANKGLPFVPTYNIKVQVPDAAELVAGSEVRIGGARVGQVNKITAEPRHGSQPPLAQLNLALDKNRAGLAEDTTAHVRPASILGSKYVELVPGRSPAKIPQGGTLSVKHALPAAEIDEAFDIFDHQTSQGLRNSITALGNSLAGRGRQLNDTIVATGQLLPPLQRVLTLLADPATGLDGFIRGAVATTSALAPVAPQLGSLLDKGAITLKAIDAAGPALGETLDQLPPTEVAGSHTLADLTPTLADAARLSRALRPGSDLLPIATDHLASALEATTPVLRRTPSLADKLGGALVSLDLLSRDKASSGAVRKLIETLNSLEPTLDVFNPAQTHCNVFGLWTRNLSSIVSEGDESGPAINAELIVGPQMLPSATKAPDLHVNPYPNENAQECESGNETFTANQQLIGNPPGLQSSHTEITRPPASATALARKAGLLGGSK